MRRSIVVALLLIPLGATIAQQSDRIDSASVHSGLRITLAPAQRQLNDRLLSPVRSVGLIGAGGVEYVESMRSGEHSIVLDGSFGFLSNRYDLPTAAGGIVLGYGYLQRLSAPDDGWLFSAGGYLAGKIDISFSYMLDESHLYWLTAYELGARGRAEHAVGSNGRFSIEASLPLLSYVARPPEYRNYNNDIPDFSSIMSSVHERLALRSFDGYWGFDCSIVYDFDITPRLGERIGYRASYRRASEPQPIDLLLHSLVLGIYYRL